MSTSVKQTETEKNRGAAIMLAVEIDSSFKLYSYHIIDHEQFVSRINELIGFYKFETITSTTELSPTRIANLKKV